MNPNERRPGEDFEKFRARRALQNKMLKARSRGSMLWPARMGTYRRKLHGELTK